MIRLLVRLWREDLAATYTIEILLVATLIVLGATVGLGRVRGALVHELNDIANGIGSVNQSFIVPPLDVCGGRLFAAGSGFRDASDEGDCAVVDTGGQVKDHTGNINKSDVTSSSG